MYHTLTLMNRNFHKNLNGRRDGTKHQLDLLPQHLPVNEISKYDPKTNISKTVDDIRDNCCNIEILFFKKNINFLEVT